MYINSPKPTSAHSPTLETLHRVERILRAAAAKTEGPISLSEIARRMPARKVRRETVKACVNELARFHAVSQDRSGVMWALTTSDEVWNKKRAPLE